MRVRIFPGKGFFPLLFSSLLVVLCLGGCAENSSILDDGKSRQLEFSVKTCNWNNSNSSSSDYKPVSRATPISGASFDTSKSFNVIADVNKGGSWSSEVDNETASYSTANNIWQTTATHYWPGAASSVNFYAYYPTSISSKVTHSTGSAPILSYIVPDNATDQIDILASSKTGVAGNSYNQTPVDFKHILAAVQFRVGSSGMINGTITKISLNGIQNTGSYSFTSGWTPQTSSTTTYTKNVSAAGDAGTEIVSGNDPFLVMPQALSNASFTVTYSGGATLTKDLSGTWEAGKVYEYNINSSFSATQDFSYTGDVQSYTVPFTGTYKIECWGAEGGDDPNKGGALPGKGAYTSGYINLTSGKQLFLYIGGVGSSLYKQINYGGWNGGGTSTSNVNTYFPSGGGGSTDVRLIEHLGSDGWSGTSSLRSRIMVAAGGGGCLTDGYSTIANGANAGGLKGYVAYNTANSSFTESDFDGTGSTQISCGSCPAYVDPNWQYSKYLKDGTINPWGYFGYANQLYVDLYWAGGGGGGWWGGLSVHGRGGGGGSSFISGMSGCIAMAEDGTQNSSINYMTINGTIYSFTSPVMIDGASSMPAPLGGTETGHSGNGYARITFVSAN